MKGFLLYQDMRQPFETLTDEDAGKLIKLIFAYECGEQVLASGTAGTAFNFLKPTLERDRSKYEARCERNREIAKTRKKPEKKEDLFQIFWDAYPRHDAKASAEKAFHKVSEKLLRETILPDLEKRKKSDGWKEKAYIPHAATYINGKRWEDEITKSEKRDFAEREVKDEDYADIFVDLN